VTLTTAPAAPHTVATERTGHLPVVPDRNAALTSPVGVARSSAPTVSVVAPARNEAANLARVLPLLPDCVTELVLVDGRSTDDTVEVARAYWPDVVVVHQDDTRGKGAAMCLGAKAASSDVVVFLDTDGSMDPREIAAYVGALQGGADLAKGSRFATGAHSHDITPIRRFGNWGLRTLANVVFRQRWTELNYGFFAMWRENVHRLGLDDLVQHGTEDLHYGHGFEIETLTFARAARQRLRVVEIASIEYERIFGESNLLTFRDGWRVLCSLLREGVGPKRRKRPAAGRRELPVATIDAHLAPVAATP
jgi:glycosyltransferase involved in cell wall biosynthesis